MQAIVHTLNSDSLTQDKFPARWYSLCTGLYIIYQDTIDESVESVLTIPIKDAGFIMRTYGASCRARSCDTRIMGVDTRLALILLNIKDSGLLTGP